MAILKPAEGPHTLTIASVEAAEGQFGAQWKFASTSGDLLFLSEMAAARQIARLGMTMESCVGETFVFSQTKKDGKTFNNIALATGDAAQAPQAASRAAAGAAPAPAPRQAKMTTEEAMALYSRCVDIAVNTLGVTLESKGIPFDGSAIQAAAATIFIACK